MGHSLFSPSAAPRWLACPGSMAFPENRDPDGGSSTYADDGSASHELAAYTLSRSIETTCASSLGTVITINGREYRIDEERADRIQGYVDYVRRQSIGGYLYVEKQVDLSHLLGAGQGGTADAAIALPHKNSTAIIDLKDGSEKVYASYLVQPATGTTPEVREPNPQLALYALGMLPDWELFGPIDEVLLVIYQPKLNHIDEFKISVDSLKAFGEKARAAVELARAAMAAGADSLTTAGYLHAGTKQCRWCRAAARCPELRAVTERETRSDFEEEIAQLLPPPDTKGLARAFNHIPLIEIWCKAVKAEVQKQVTEGNAVIGPDGKPYKFVEGKQGDRAWADPAVAEAALTGQLGPKAYSDPKLLTAAAAAKVLDKKATKQIWADVFVPLIKRAPGRPMLVMGSDERPAFSGAGQAEDFEEDLSV